MIGRGRGRHDMKQQELDIIAAWAVGREAEFGYLRTDGVTLWRHCTPIAWKPDREPVNDKTLVTVTCGGWANDNTRNCVQAVVREVINLRGLQHTQDMDWAQALLAQELMNPAAEIVL